MRATTMAVRPGAKKQKEILASEAMDTIVQPLELRLFDLQLRLEGKQTNNNMELALAKSKLAEQEQQNLLMGCLMAAYLEEIEKKHGGKREGRNA
ncbi:MAG: hypothetical protein LBB50_02545 [Oscillospiraceae bacterium]|nr:hypothetical protein [Oscillospiraceae bacterium]